MLADQEDLDLSIFQDLVDGNREYRNDARTSNELSEDDPNPSPPYLMDDKMSSYIYNSNAEAIPAMVLPDDISYANIDLDVSDFSNVFNYEYLQSTNKIETEAAPSKANTKKRRKDSITSISPKQEFESSLKFNINDLSSRDALLMKKLCSNLKKGFQSDDEDDESEDSDPSDDSVVKDNKKKKGKKSAPTNDALLIAAAVEEHLKSLHLDPNSKEGKHQRRRLRNRMSAQLHRERKKAYIDELEATIREKDCKIEQMHIYIESLVRENEKLRGAIGLPIVKYEYPYDSISVTSSEAATSEDESQNPRKKNNWISKSGYRLLATVMIICCALFGNQSVLQNNSTSVVFPVVIPQLPSPLMNEDWNNVALVGMDISSIEAPHRRLLSTDMENEIDNDSGIGSTNFPSLSYPESHISSGNIVSSNHALWKYQDKAIQLFPKLKFDESISGIRSISRKFLRSRSVNINSSDEKSKLDSLFGGMSTHLVVSSSQDSSISRVLMTEGKALLDPSLAINKAKVANTVSNLENDSSSVVSAVSTWLVPKTDSLSEQYPIQLAASQSVSTTATQSSNQIVAIPTSDNVLIMLVPASTVRWGKSWSDSVDNSMDWMIRTMNGNASDFSSNPNDNLAEGSSDLQGMWVEIGCSIFKAQLVKNVTLTA